MSTEVREPRAHLRTRRQPPVADATPINATPTRRRILWLLRTFPITALVVGPYALIVVPLAVFYGNPELGFIVWLVCVAGASTAVVEGSLRVLAGLRRPPDDGGADLTSRRYVRVHVIARAVAVASIAADLTAALAGRGSVANQVLGEVVSSPIVSLATLIAGWKYLAVGLLLYAFKHGHTSVATFYRWTAALMATQLVVALLTAIVAPFMGYAFFVTAAGAITGVVRTRYVIVTLAVLLIAWPTLFGLRNDLRQANGIRVAADLSAVDRLRFDQQLGRLSPYRVPVDVGQPGLAEIAAYGLVPRILDPGRPTISTGININRYLGGSGRSAYSFLAMGNVYFLNGLGGLIAYFGGWSALATLLLIWRRQSIGLFRISLFCFVIVGPLSWLATYPDVMIGTVQQVVAALPVLFAIWATSTRPPTASAPDPHAS